MVSVDDIISILLKKIDNPNVGSLLCFFQICTQILHPHYETDSLITGGNSCLSEWLSSKRQEVTNAGEDVENSALLVGL